MDNLQIWEAVVILLVCVGALNWLIVAISKFSGKLTVIPDLFYYLGLSSLAPIVYVLVGAAGIASTVSVSLALAR